MQSLDLFAIAPPGLEHQLMAELREKGFASVTSTPGGIAFKGDMAEIMRANLELRGATRILMRLGSFMAFHLAQLDKRARKFPFHEVIPEGSSLRVEASCHASRIYHANAAAERVEKALTFQGYHIAADAPLTLKLRIDDNRATLSLDTSGEALHKRGHKLDVGKAPMRETLAALFLRQAGFDGSEPLIDPMCGSGTFPIEAAEIAAGLQAGRSRDFAMTQLKGARPEDLHRLRRAPDLPATLPLFQGFDRDAGAITRARANAKRAGLETVCRFDAAPISALTRPDGPPGLMITNPPYGTRISNKKMLYALYGSLGARMRAEFSGWRAAVITSDPALAKATGLPFKPKTAPVPHGGLKIWLFHTDPL